MGLDIYIYTWMGLSIEEDSVVSSLVNCRSFPPHLHVELTGTDVDILSDISLEAGHAQFTTVPF